MLAGWTHSEFSDSLDLRLQTIRSSRREAPEDVDSHHIVMTKNQATVLANYLFQVAGQTPPQPSADCCAACSVSFQAAWALRPVGIGGRLNQQAATDQADHRPGDQEQRVVAGMSCTMPAASGPSADPAAVSDVMKP